jgi:hypothetical protein
LAIKYLYEGKTRKEVSDLLDCHYKILSTWIDKFLEGGLKVEYIIHLLRLKLLHHLSLDVNIQQVKDKLEKFCIRSVNWGKKRKSTGSVV